MFVLVLTTAPGVVLAQSYEYHPVISDNFTVSLGYMHSSNSFDFESNAIGDPGDDIDVDSDDWTGGAEMTYSGPIFSMIFAW
jgi:hypothetical protein